MIDAVEAYNMMPSAIRNEEYKKEILKELENKVIDAAKRNETSIILRIPPIKFKLIREELEKLHYFISNLSKCECESEYLLNPSRFCGPYRPVHDTSTGEFYFFYRISWDF